MKEETRIIEFDNTVLHRLVILCDSYSLLENVPSSDVAKKIIAVWYSHESNKSLDLTAAEIKELRHCINLVYVKLGYISYIGIIAEELYKYLGFVLYSGEEIVKLSRKADKYTGTASLNR